MRHLIKTGRRRIVHATFVRQETPTASRRVGYARAMAQARLKPEYLYYPLSEQQRATVRQLIRDFVKTNGCPDAIFCHSDDVALGIYRGLCDLGIRVPDQVAIVGCDGIQDTEYLEVPLTTLVQPVVELCDASWKFLTQRIEHPQTKRQQIVLKPTLAIRESSAPAKSVA
jgi:DNA-binding LacI/PurR family transcriptional regulator